MLIHAKEIKKGVEQLQGTGTSCERRKGSAATCEELETLLRKSHVPVEFDTNLRFIEKSGVLAGRISTSSTCADLRR